MGYIIYKHTLNLNCEHFGWSYIGQTKQEPEARGQKGNGYKGCKLFYSAIQKYGGDNFTHEIIESNLDTPELANEREQYWITFFHTGIGDEDNMGYNLTPGGSTPNSKTIITNGIDTLVVYASELNTKYDLTSGRELSEQEKYKRGLKNQLAKRKLGRQSHKDIVNAQQQQYRATHKDLVKEQNKRHHEKYKEADNARCRNYCQKHAKDRNYRRGCQRGGLPKNELTLSFGIQKQTESLSENKFKKRFTLEEINCIISIVNNKQGDKIICQQEDL